MGTAFSNQPKKGYLEDSKPFSREDMTSSSLSGLSFGDPARFSMQQSYSTTMGYGGTGSFSHGLYLNRLSYQFSDPLKLSVDLGFYTPFYSSGLYNSALKEGDKLGSFVIPRVSLEYQPTKNTQFSIHLLNIGPSKGYYPYYLGH